ncbi:CheY chemotaxis protein or a CheY-like REC (receiver) domain [Desulfacinum hydrothermale DSM 13146]|uniref:CheY chemotaxis protein or a CheY-like REC (Receiver) domain n=1 Tax=Desulfacinum hydrothermale DSM 13146 TaxID=1121390 RepID=A0A1W1XUE0_9BACT|nr:response regulator [Desulfacinum hydrothermale]SMC27573.1 CheY chemotaxis protein or a CheY-like REC (receiver) domain [Desulfacinum hydrothermale DSM 13146]
MILIVMTNAANRRVLRQVLEKEGLNVVEAGGIEALAEVIRNNGSLQAALIDITGLEARIWDQCGELHKRQVPFLMLSSRQSRALEAASVAHGARGVLVKPLTIQHLVQLLRSLLENP